MKVFTAHGFMGTPLDFAFLSKLSTRLEFIHLSLPGHHQTPATENNWAEVCEKYEKLITKEADGHDFALLGYSMGGRLFLGVSELLYQHKTSNFKGLILESAHVGLDNDDQRQKRMKIDLELLKDVDSKKKLEAFLRSWWSAPLFGDLNRHEDFEGLIEHKREGNYKEWKKALILLSVANQPHYEYLFKEKNFPPTLYIAGTRDQKYFELAKRLEAYQKVETHYFDSGHNAHFQCTYKFFGIIEGWLLKLVNS